MNSFLHKLIFTLKNIFLLIFINFVSIKCFANISENRGIVIKEIITGHVEKENFTYYIVNLEVDVLLNLSSIVGDCDLYISQASKTNGEVVKPNIDIFGYDLHSATCGQDLLLVDGNIRRPFCIGIYAHPSHQMCQFTLEFIGFETDKSITFNDRYENTEYENENEAAFNEQEKASTDNDDKESDNVNNLFFIFDHDSKFAIIIQFLLDILTEFLTL